MESTIVIKIKYGETLRRINARINEDGYLDLDMGRLREKILGLFNFTSDADLTLTYIDEDGDIVTLVDEEDLHDVMRQSLNPLRVNVKLNAEKGGRSYTRPSGSSTPMRSPRVEHPLPNLNVRVSDIVKSVPEPLCEALSKLSLDLASKAASSAPLLAELVDNFSKMGQSYMNRPSEFQAATEFSTQAVASGSATGASMTKETDASKDDGSSTPMRSTRVQHPPPNLNIIVSDTFKSVPEPFRESLSKLALDLASKAATAAPEVSELVDSFSRMGQSNVNQPSEFQAAIASSTQASASGSAMGISMTKEPEASKDHGATLEVIPNSNFEEPTGKTTQKVDHPKGTRGAEVSVAPSSGSLNINAGLPSDSLLSGSVSANRAPVAPRDHIGDFGQVTKSGTSNFPPNNYKEARKSNKPKKPVSTDASGSTADPTRHSTTDFKNTNLGGGARMTFPIENLIKKLSFTGMPVASDPAVPFTSYGSLVPPFKRSYNQSEDMGNIFHSGVHCDGCGVHPITGPRFKSKVKINYDLCSICFSEMGNEADYIRIDRPFPYQHPHPRVLPPIPHLMRGCRMKPSHPKLNSRFVLDVNVPDDTIMAPSMPFTKIWRMQNNGTIVWPQGTQLVWIEGDKINDALSVGVQIPSDGLLVGNELDVAVDFIAPELPGRYTSCWRMATPWGRKFGQRIWVCIRVVASLKDSMCDSLHLHGLNLNLPPDSSGISGSDIISVNVEPMAVDNRIPEHDSSNWAMGLVEPVVDTYPNKDQDLNFPINDTLLVGGGLSNHRTPEARTSVSYPIIDFSEGAPFVPLPSTNVLASAHGGGVSNTITPEAAPMSVSYPMIDLSEVAPIEPFQVPYASFDASASASASAQRAGESSDVEQTLLRELNEMGFKHLDLNKEILRMNEYDLERSVEDLCDVSEWDPVLEELREMGFCDEEMNKRLLKKNNGSVKRVVMDILAGEKA